jgi:hypothetical protein
MEFLMEPRPDKLNNSLNSMGGNPLHIRVSGHSG